MKRAPEHTESELLERAATEIEHRAQLHPDKLGWTPGCTYDGPNRAACRVDIEGAMTWPATNHHTGAVDPTRHTAGAILNRAVGNYIAWNDAEGRTQDQVLGLLRRAAAYAADLPPADLAALRAEVLTDPTPTPPPVQIQEPRHAC